MKLTTQVQLLKRLRRRGAIPLLPKTSLCYGDDQLYLLTYFIPAASGGAVVDEYTCIYNVSNTTKYFI